MSLNRCAPHLATCPYLRRMLAREKGAYALVIRSRCSRVGSIDSKSMPANPSNKAVESPCTATAMRKAARRLAVLYDLAIAPTGVRSTQFAILAEIATRDGRDVRDGRDGRDGPTMAELARGLVMDRSALGHNLRPLERDGLVTWSEGAEDRRRRHVSLTAAGKARFREAARGWKRAQARFDAVFGERESEALRKTLLRIANDPRFASLEDE
jgi:DNA-binding MarR family transcriptional regulator